MMPHLGVLDQSPFASIRAGYDADMTTSPAEPVENDQSNTDSSQSEDFGSSSEGIDDSQLPEELQPGEDNPLATPDTNVGGAPKPGEDAVPEGESAPGDPSIG
jgi:hypothetical protein